LVTDHPLVDSHSSAAGIEECVEGEWEGGLLPPKKRNEELPLVAGGGGCLGMCAAEACWVLGVKPWHVCLLLTMVSKC